MQNTIVVKLIADNRVQYFHSQASGIPTIAMYDQTNFPDATADIFDSSTMDFVVGVPNYDDSGIWDSSTDLLTDAACAALGIDTADKAKFLRDTEIDMVAELRGVNYVDDLMCAVSGGVVTITESIQAVSERPTHLRLSVTDYSGITDEGTDPVSGNQCISLPTTPGTSWLEITVQKYDADGNILSTPDDDDEIVLCVSAGKICDAFKQPLALGTAAYYIIAPDESITWTFNAVSREVYEPGKELQGGTLSVLIASTGDPAP